jgi:hypothetical protein
MVEFNKLFGNPNLFQFKKPLPSPEQSIADKVYKYDEVLPIEAYNSSVWLVEFEYGQNLLQIWHKDAKIEHVVAGMKMLYPDSEFTVAAVDVGSVWISQIENMMSNGRKLNQNMEVVI